MILQAQHIQRVNPITSSGPISTSKPSLSSPSGPYIKPGRPMDHYSHLERPGQIMPPYNHS